MSAASRPEPRLPDWLVHNRNFVLLWPRKPSDMTRRQDKPKPAADDAPPDNQRRLWRILALSALVPLAAANLLYHLRIPLGCPGRLVYLYSPWPAMRLKAVPAAVACGVVLGLGTWLLSASASRRRRVGSALVALGAAALAVWSYFGAPGYLGQHILNAHSPSHEGAFVREALKVDSVRDYLRAFPDRASTPPEQMRGTRVISNPPGTTLLAVATESLLRRCPALRERISRPLAASSPTERIRRSATLGLLFFGVLTALWLISGAFLYLTGRLFLPAASSAAYAVCCFFSPMTLLFTPGKDPAQLLTVAIPLCLWFLAYRSDRAWAAGLAGLTFILAILASLVHIWIGAIVLLATLFAARHPFDELRRVLLRVVGPAAGAACIGALGLYLLCDLNLVATIRAVSQSQAAVTRGPEAMPLVWQLLGVPLFLLFVGPACWAVMLWAALPGAKTPRARDAQARLGRYLIVGCVAVMLATIGFSNLETPRLWIPFVPLLLLGGLLQLTTLRQTCRRTALLLAMLVGVQVAVSALHWSLMDMREAETRWYEQRFFGSPDTRACSEWQAPDAGVLCQKLSKPVFQRSGAVSPPRRGDNITRLTANDIGRDGCVCCPRTGRFRAPSA